MPTKVRRTSAVLQARLPLDLVQQVQQYAAQHRLSVSELIKDGLEMRLEAGDVPGRTLPPEPETLSPAVVEALKTLIRETLREGSQPPTPATIPQALPVLPSILPTVLPYDLPTILPYDLPTIPPADTVLPHVLPVPTEPGATYYDASKFYLGKLCPRGHAYGTTGKSVLRRANNNCPQCQNERRREQRAQQKVDA